MLDNQGSIAGGGRDFLPLHLDCC